MIGANPKERFGKTNGIITEYCLVIYFVAHPIPPRDFCEIK